MEPIDVMTFARQWFGALNSHAPVEDALGFLDPDDLEMQFPESTLHSFEEFRQWYAGVVATFFDQQHIIRQIDVSIAGDTAEVLLIVNWKAHTWTPPAAFSTRIDMDAVQSWRVRARSDGRLVISSYKVNGLLKNS